MAGPRQGRSDHSCRRRHVGRLAARPGARSGQPARAAQVRIVGDRARRVRHDHGRRRPDRLRSERGQHEKMRTIRRPFGPLESITRRDRRFRSLSPSLRRGALRGEPAHLAVHPRPVLADRPPPPLPATLRSARCARLPCGRADPPCGGPDEPCDPSGRLATALRPPVPRPLRADQMIAGGDAITQGGLSTTLRANP
jgi:hypothetical protein